MSKDTAEYSSSKSPETQHHAEEHDDVVDSRLIPGGAEPRTPSAQGMAGLDSDAVPSDAHASGQRHDRDTGRDDDAGD